MKLCNEFKACTIELCTQLHEIDRTIKSYQNSDNFTPVFFLVVATYIYVCVYSILGQLKLLGTTMAIPYVGLKKQRELRPGRLSVRRALLQVIRPRRPKKVGQSGRL
jgi:hypothetical protein